MLNCKECDCQKECNARSKYEDIMQTCTDFRAFVNGIRADERAKTIDELINELKHNSTNISETGYQYHEYSDDELDEIAEQMKEVRNE